MTEDEIDEAVEAWHKGEDPRPLHEVLGMTWDEYGRWLIRPGEDGTE